MVPGIRTAANTLLLEPGQRVTLPAFFDDDIADKYGKHQSCNDIGAPDDRCVRSKIHEMPLFGRFKHCGLTDLRHD